MTAEKVKGAMFRKPWVRELGLYAAAVALCGLCLTGTLKLWKADFGVPLGNDGDCLLTQVVVKNAMERGTYYECDRIGAPYGADLRDFPMSENLHFGVMRLLALGTNNPFRVINYYYLLSYFFTVLAALFTLRRFAVAALPALTAALLYAFLPYHLLRNVGHLFLSSYYLIPLLVMVALWVYLGRLRRQAAGTTPEPRRALGWRWAGAVLVCLLVSGAGVYYAYFACFFLLTAGLACALRERRWVPLVPAGALVAVLAAGVVLNLLPCLIYRHENGPNADVGQRLKWESELYGLKLTHLLLPIHEHRLSLVREWKELYSLGGPWPSHEGCFAAPLGAVGAVGCAFVVLSFLFGRRDPGGPLLVPGLGLFTVCGFLLGVTGGLGALFANYVTPQIRAYNRVSIYLGFFALFGAAVLLTRLLDQARRWGLPGRLIVSGFCLLLLGGGVWDQTNSNMVPPYAATKAGFESQVAFTAQVEQQLPAGAMVFQLPFTEFPEACPTDRGLTSYEQFRPYLVSRTLRWSHGTVRNRYGSKALAALTRQPVEALVEQVAVLGYSGIHVDRLGYADNGTEVEGRLRALLGEEPLVGPNQRDAFFTLVPYARKIRSQYTEEEWARRREWYQDPVVAIWGEGADRAEGEWRWCHSRATLTLINPLERPRTVSIRFRPDFASPEPKPRLTMTGSVVGGTVDIDPGSAPFRTTVAVPPGTHALRFECDGKATHDASGRTLVFRLLELEVVADDLPPALAGPTAPAGAKPEAH
jgi:phosphoglycerol transferase